ncbi:MAG: sugar kinase [Phycisphaeraceae bacterium]|nr:sugar kinase [Phycisphaeraceae bacterium]MCP4795752.1 sugar kinase [Phycisphaeraceae bacterium]MCP4939662.1 sugar kinase [Phycisphaeraceae bacterium]MDG1978251.1 PfkB family carbohydrate kinase [Phycisphaerales bacterium]MDG2134261.1 PfkB family carbohydrate kinase [Phycisphaerales bacterium]
MLIVTGTIGVDTIHAPTGSAEGVMGGSAAYFAAAASHLAPTRLVGLVGEDWPQEHRDVLQSFDGIDFDGVEVRAGGETFKWGGRYFDDMNQRETLFTELGVLEDTPPTVPEGFRDSRYVFLANSHPAVQANLLSQFPDRAIAVCDTMDLWINIAHDDLLALLKQVDGVVLNDQEAMQLVETRNVVDAGRKILELGPTFAVIKKGEHGAVLVHRDGVAVVPAYPADHASVVDPTGAGDSFGGGMMAHLARLDRTDFEAIQESLAWGTIMASFTIGSFGLTGLQEADESRIRERMERYRSMARIG